MPNYTKLCRVASNVAVEDGCSRIFTKFRGGCSEPDLVVTAKELDAMSSNDVVLLCTGKFVLYKE